MHLLVDPVILYCCRGLPGSITPPAYLTSLRRWRHLIVHGSGNEFHISTRCELALYSQKCFLNSSCLGRYFRGFFGGKFPVRAISTICNSIVKRSYDWPRLPESEPLPPAATIKLTPNLCARIPNPAIAESLEKTLGYIAWNRNTIK